MIRQEVYDYAVEFTTFLQDYVTDRKKQLIEAKLKHRTRYLTVVLEDIHKSHNASAVLRTSECFGIQDIHIVEKEHPYSPHPHISSGSARWVNLHHYDQPNTDNTKVCLDALKRQGYRILVTSLNDRAKPFDVIDVNTKSAIVFGTEYSGVSDEAIEMADEVIHIPMVGFTESLNLSVSAGIILQHYRGILDKFNVPWQLSEKEIEAIRLTWTMNSVRKIDIHIKHFLAERI
jgi:tRNA (guanosine-2'-O-)-methyltransferase